MQKWTEFQELRRKKNKYTEIKRKLKIEVHREMKMDIAAEKKYIRA